VVAEDASTALPPGRVGVGGTAFGPAFFTTWAAGFVVVLSIPVLCVAWEHAVPIRSQIPIIPIRVAVRMILCLLV
jgi:hypothetical protein